MVEPESLVLDHLRAIHSDIAKMSEGIHTLGVEMIAIRQHLSGVVTIQELDHIDIAGIKTRLDRIEKRLELAD